MLPLYTTIFTRCTFRLVSRPKRERERDGSGRQKKKREREIFRMPLSYVFRDRVRGDAFLLCPVTLEKGGLPNPFVASFIYIPGGIRVSKDTRGRSCCNFISRMRPHAPAVCFSFFFLFLLFPVPFSARHDGFDFTSGFGKHISTCQSSGVSHLLLSRLSTQTFVLD